MENRVTAIPLPRLRWRAERLRRRRALKALEPLLREEAEAVHGLRAAVREANPRWVAPAYERWIAAHEMTLRVWNEAGR
jgi:hypothetical protein